MFKRLAYLISYVMYSDNTNDTSKEEKLDNENKEDVKTKEKDTGEFLHL